ncbi:hypothetical protein NSA50_00360 [Clostridium sp. DSM 100503]|uniref:hypothetical protein n=1 Tax=Clostridium sp. DSM 100503 TaxID=2963282 RepID=UPI002149FCCC|nr:hypothetical protein [Clostridium sp. DSM 100503]MCR1949505.1 hypothetical protein [Clostridium sp. DSM 100503]
MRKFKKIIMSIIFILVIIIIFIFKSKYSNDVTVKKWDNIYNENNITFFYEEKDDEKIKILKDMYNTEEKLDGEKDKIKKAIRISEILNEIITFDDVPNTKGINGYDILKEKNGAKKASARDLGIIYRDFLESVGYTARLGEFRRTDAKLSKQNSYYVVEFWSKEDNKWIMIDFIDRGYFDKEGFYCSAVELLDEDVRNLNYTGNSDRRNYIPMLKKSLYTYTISIDNTTDMKKSNSYVTYVKNTSDITFKFKGSYITPTIFTQNKDLMSKNPIDTTVNSDEKAYIILMKKQEQTSLEDKNENNSFVIGAFKDGKILDEYYIKEKDSGFRKVKKYSDILLTKGDNLIELSLDGENVVSSIEIDYKK